MRKKKNGPEMSVHAQQWINCVIGHRLELCKVILHPLSKEWSVITYYDGIVLFKGTLSECKQFIEDRRVHDHV